MTVPSTISDDNSFAVAKAMRVENKSRQLGRNDIGGRSLGGGDDLDSAGPTSFEQLSNRANVCLITASIASRNNPGQLVDHHDDARATVLVPIVQAEVGEHLVPASHLADERGQGVRDVVGFDSNDLGPRLPVCELDTLRIEQRQGDALADTGEDAAEKRTLAGTAEPSYEQMQAGRDDQRFTRGEATHGPPSGQCGATAKADHSTPAR